jgi:hypothetical protein
MSTYSDQQLILDVVKGLDLQRLTETYEIIFIRQHMYDIFIKYGVHLILCPASNAYARINDSSVPMKRSVHAVEKNMDDSSTTTRKSTLIDYVQAELIDYSIASLLPRKFGRNLSQIYQELTDQRQDQFTCEYVRLIYSRPMPFIVFYDCT